MKYNSNKYISNLILRERCFMNLAVGVTILGGVVLASSELKDPSGLVMIYGGVYSAAVSQEYGKMVDNFIDNEKKEKQYVKSRKRDIK